MKLTEDVLIRLLSRFSDPNTKAVLLQSYIARHGLLSDDAGTEVIKQFSQEGKKTE